MLDANSPEFLRRVDTLTKVVNKNIQLIDSDPVIVIPTLMRLLCVTLVSEYITDVTIGRFRWRDVRVNAFAAFKQSLDQAIDFAKQAISSLPANDTTEES